MFPLDWVTHSHPNYVSSDICKTHIITESAFYKALEHGNQGEHNFNIQDPPYLTARRREIKDVKFEEDYKKGIEEGTIHVHMDAMQVNVNGRNVYLSSPEASALANMAIQRNAQARRDAMRIMPEVELIEEKIK